MQNFLKGIFDSYYSQSVSSPRFDLNKIQMMLRDVSVIEQLLNKFETMLFQKSVDLFLLALQVSPEVQQIYELNVDSYINLLFLQQAASIQKQSVKNTDLDDLIPYLRSHKLYDKSFLNCNSYVKAVLLPLRARQPFRLQYSSFPSRLQSKIQSTSPSVQIQFYEICPVLGEINASRNALCELLPDAVQICDEKQYLRTVLNYIQEQLQELQVKLDYNMEFDYWTYIQRVNKVFYDKADTNVQFSTLQQILQFIKQMKFVQQCKNSFILPQKYNVFIVQSSVVFQFLYKHQYQHICTLQQDNQQYEVNIKLYIDNLFKKGQIQMLDLLYYISIFNFFYIKDTFDGDQFINLKIAQPNFIVYTTNFDFSSTYQIKNFLQPEYQLQYLQTRLITEYQFISQKIISKISNDVFQNLCNNAKNAKKCTYIFNAAAILQKLLVYYHLMLYSIDDPIGLLIQLVETYKFAESEMMIPYSLINLGFLRHDNEILKDILKNKIIFYQIPQFDLKTTMKTLFLQFKKNPLQKILQDNQKLTAFSRQLTDKQSILYEDYTKFKQHEDKNYYYLIVLLHEHQYSVQKRLNIKLSTQFPQIFQIISAITSYCPTSAYLKLQFNNQAGIDAGGISRAVINQLADELIGEASLNDEIIAFLRQTYPNNKFSDLPQGMHKTSILKAFNSKNSCTLWPQYAFRTQKEQKDVQPRLIAGVPALYSLGRLFSYCLVYNYQFPNILSQPLKNALLQTDFQYDVQYFKNDTVFDIVYIEEVNALNSVKRADDLQLLVGNIPGIDDEKAIKHTKSQLKQLKTGTTFVGSYDALRSGFISGFSNNKVLETLILKCSKEQLENLIFSSEVNATSYVDDNIFHKAFLDINTEQFKLFEQHKGNNAQLKTIQQQYMLQVHQLNQLIDSDSQYYNKLIYELLQDEFIQNEGNQSHTQILTRMVSILQKMNVTQLRNCVFAATGSRNLKNNTLKVNIIKQNNQGQTQLLAQFHVCNNKIDVQSSWFQLYDDDWILEHINRSVELALQTGFELA